MSSRFFVILRTSANESIKTYTAKNNFTPLKNYGQLFVKMSSFEFKTNWSADSCNFNQFLKVMKNKMFIAVEAFLNNFSIPYLLTSFNIVFNSPFLKHNLFKIHIDSKTQILYTQRSTP